MTDLIQNILQISISTAAVIGVMLLLVPIWQKRYSAKWRKVIWLVIAVRLLIPFSIELPTAPVQMNVDLDAAVQIPISSEAMEQIVSQPAGTDVKTAANPVANTQISAVMVPNTQTTQTQQTVQSGLIIDRSTVLFALWLIGLILFTIYHAVQYRRFYGKIMASARPVEDSNALLERAGKDLALSRYPAVLFSGGVQSPMLIGYRNPNILLPYKLYGENELVMILRHELTHYKHHDLWYKLILLCANAVHWFNPLVWLMNRQAGRDLEQVCDDCVVNGQDMEYRKAYSMTILNTMASQKGVALSTHLSKDAQNTKKRFSAILQPKQYKKGVAVLLAVLVLAVGISGCLQVGKVDEGVALYNKVAEYLPENAIHEPEVYEVQGADDEDSDYISYIWAEEWYEVTEEEYNQAGSLAGYRKWNKDEGYFLTKRSLGISILKETGNIESVFYGSTEDKAEPVKPSEIGRDKEKRDAYVQQIAADLLADGENLTFTEALTDADENGNTTLGYYVCGTEADPDQYVMVLDYTEGNLQMLRWVRYDSEQMENVTVWRDFTIMLEGMEETVRLNLNRQSGYYAMYTDDTIFHRVPQEVNIDGAFCDKYLRRVEDTPIQSYIKVGFVPDITVDEWVEKVETDSDYAVFAPQNNPLSSAVLIKKWESTGEYKTFPRDPARQWQVLKAYGAGEANICCITPYQDGVMVVQLSFPSAPEYVEGIATRMHYMADTLVLAAEGEEYIGKKQNSNAANMDNGTALYNQIAQFLPEHVIENPADYQKTPYTDYTEYIWGENPFAVSSSSQYPPLYEYPYGLMICTDNSTGEIIRYYFWYDDNQITLPAVAETENEAKTVGETLAENFMMTMVPNCESLTVKRQISQMQYQQFTAIDEELYQKYQISVNGMHGYISSFNKNYYNAAYEETMLDWLNEEYRTHLGDAYRLYSDPLTVDSGGQTLKENAFTMYVPYTMYWRYQPDDKQQNALEHLRETAPEQYELIQNNLDARCAYSGMIKVTGSVKNNGNLKKNSLQFYDSVNGYESAMDKTVWAMLDDKLQIMWIAASYANTWNHRYSDAMALYGITDNVSFAEETFDIYQTELVKYAQEALQEYRGETSVEVKMPLERNAYECTNYLNLTLEKADGVWYVTSAAYNKGIQTEVFYANADYDLDGGLDTVQRIWNTETDTALYEVLFSNGDVLKTDVWYDSLAVPSFEGADFTGDGQNEIVFYVEWPSSTNPLAAGELAVFHKNVHATSYGRLASPFASGEGVYEQNMIVTYNKAEGQAIEVSVDDTDFRKIIEIPDELWNDWNYGTSYTDGYKQAHTVWNYKIQQQDGANQMVCSVQLFDKWSPWGLDFVVEYQENQFVITDILFCENIYDAW